MKKLLTTALFTVLLLPSLASAELLKNLRMGGQLDVQSNSARNIQDFTTRDRTPSGGRAPFYNDRLGNTLTRTMVDLHWDLLDDVHAELTFRKNNRVWGSSTTAASGYASTASMRSDQYVDASEPVGSGGILGQLFLNRANITIDKLFGFADMTLGRQYYGAPGDLVLFWGPKDSYGFPTTAIDAVSAKFETDHIRVTGMAGTTKASEYQYVGSTSPYSTFLSSASASKHIRGLDIMLKIPHVKVNTYVWNQLIQASAGLGNTFNAPGANDNLYVYGMKVRAEAHGQIFGFWMNLDTAFNTGTCSAAGNCLLTTTSGPDQYNFGTHYSGYGGMVDTGVNLDIPNVGGFTPWGHFAWGSGRRESYGINDGFYTIASDYRPGIINRRFGALLFDNFGVGNTADAAGGPRGGVGTTGLNNRVVWGAGMNMTIAAIERLTTSFQFWDYRFQRNTMRDPNFTTTNPATEKTSRSVGNKHIGSEAGMTLTWAHSENVNLTVGGATFQPGGYIRNWIDNRNTVNSQTNNNGRGVNPAYAMFADWMVRF
ncbi:MAG: hypothetical protein A2X36_00335 [Elusimicrobia bacterium GWA2_69_24]|nr:MAG: hypothetical protein A2X36_00335 [Elusimicrobia bacterium GWA2_69_24]HBL16758.1 hypothetical protein [Elusimicrobiota bacterium]